MPFTECSESAAAATVSWSYSDDTALRSNALFNHQLARNASPQMTGQVAQILKVYVSCGQPLGLLAEKGGRPVWRHMLDSFR